MRKLHSGMDAWRYLVRSQSRRKKRIETFLPLILSAAGALGVLPFTILRFIQGNWIAGFVDAVIVIGFVALGSYVYLTHRVRAASIAISILCIGGVMTTVYVNGPQQVYWAFPALMAVFYLIRPREAVVGATITVVSILPVLLPGTDSHVTTTILITIVVTSAFAFAFSLITNRQREQLLQLATKDPLTGVGNRRGLDAKLSDVVNTFNRSATPAPRLPRLW